METRQRDFVQYVDETAVGTLMRNVYLWMALALGITAGAAYWTASSETLLGLLFGGGSMMPFYILCGVELALVIGISAAINKISLTTATLLFVLYSVVNGVTLSSVFLAFTMGSIATTFVVCTGMFAGMALVGTFTKRDLSGIGRFCIMALIGLIIATVVNIFVASSGMDFIISIVGVLIFTALTAYDAQKIKLMLGDAAEVNEGTQKVALLGALTLYLDFINLFLYLLRFFGNRK